MHGLEKDRSKLVKDMSCSELLVVFPLLLLMFLLGLYPIYLLKSDLLR